MPKFWLKFLLTNNKYKFPHKLTVNVIGGGKNYYAAIVYLLTVIILKIFTIYLSFYKNIHSQINVRGSK